MKAKRKEEIITFKVDHALSRAMQGIPNRSAFIRSAILAALEDTCPLCMGTGLLEPDQRKHWELFSKTHVVETCEECDATHIVCRVQRGDTVSD